MLQYNASRGSDSPPVIRSRRNPSPRTSRRPLPFVPLVIVGLVAAYGLVFVGAVVAIEFWVLGYLR